MRTTLPLLLTLLLTACATPRTYTLGPQFEPPGRSGNLYPARIALPVSSNTTKTNTITVTISGEVRNPGVYELPHDTTILTAILAAGGPTVYAHLKKVYVTTESGKIYLYNLQRQDRLASPPLIWYGEKTKPGDTILPNGSRLHLALTCL